MAACGKTHYSDIIRIDMPYSGTVTDSSNGIVCIGKRDVSVTVWPYVPSEPQMEQQRTMAAGMPNKIVSSFLGNLFYFRLSYSISMAI